MKNTFAKTGSLTFLFTVLFFGIAQADTLSLSQTNVIVPAGQTTYVTSLASAQLTIVSNNNPAIAGAYVNGSQITITGLVPGNTNVTVCASTIGCAGINVTVQASSYSQTAAISFSESSASLVVGQSKSILLTGSGTYYLSTNSNNAVASASVSGQTLTINGISSGQSSLSVCASGGSNSTSCGIVIVNVTGTNTSVSSDSQSVVTFNPSSLELTMGQRKTVSIIGSGIYSVTQNSNPSVVTANINGSSVDITGLIFGGTNITICQIAGGCGNLYVYVSPINGTPVTATSSQAAASPLSLSSFAIASNNVNGFSGPGSTLTFTMGANQSINNPIVTVSGKTLNTIGIGSGPYSANYTVGGGEGMTIPIVVSLANVQGATAKASFAISSDTSGSTNNVVSTISIGTFIRNLSVGSTGADVKALQELLKKLGLYTGPITGTFGAQTESSIKKYQTQKKLSPVGVVGPATRDLLNKEK